MMGYRDLFEVTRTKFTGRCPAAGPESTIRASTLPTDANSFSPQSVTPARGQDNDRPCPVCGQLAQFAG